MKTKLIFFGMLCFNLSFGQNQSVQLVNPSITVAPGNVPLGPVASEIFRFRPGLVTQLDLGSGFAFTADRWFSLGRITQGTQTFYGSRFQTPNNALVMGYTSLSPNNPRIEWISNGASNLEFRVGTGFGSPGVPGPNSLVAKMTNSGQSIFSRDQNFIPAPLNGKTGRVVIDNSGSSPAFGIGLQINQAFGAGGGIGAAINVNDSNNPTSVIATKGLIVEAIGTGQVYGVQASTSGQGLDFEAAIWGSALQNNGQQFAGYFAGDVAVVGTINQSSDAKLKENVKSESDILGKLSKLRPITYDYKKMSEINLAKGKQHGFIAQELAEIFPELTKDIKQPIFDKENRKTSTFEFKSVNYIGLISVLTAGIQELNEELKLLKEEIVLLKDPKASQKIGSGSSLENNKGAFMQQNIPNPFIDQTTISYQLPEESTTAEIIVFDLNGRLIKTYPVNKNQSQLTIRASEIGSGLFIYSLVQNGQELLSKKMVIK